MYAYTLTDSAGKVLGVFTEAKHAKPSILFSWHKVTNKTLIETRPDNALWPDDMDFELKLPDDKIEKFQLRTHHVYSETVHL